MKKEWLMTLPAILILILIIGIWHRIGNGAAQGPDQTGTVSESITEDTQQEEETEATTEEEPVTETKPEETPEQGTETAPDETGPEDTEAETGEDTEAETAFSVRSGLIPSASISFPAQTGDAEDAPELILAVYEPEQENAEVRLRILKDGAVLQELEVPAISDQYGGLRFDGVVDVRAEDLNGDGHTDLRIVCSYVGAGSDNRGERLTKERTYMGSKELLFELERDPATDVLYGTWQEAYAAYIDSAAAADYDGYALLYINEDSIPEMVAADKAGSRGLSILLFRNGQWVEKRFFRQEVSYMERENMLCDSSGILGRFYDTVYSISGGRLNVVVEGTYGLPEDAPADAGEESYVYVWADAEVSAAGYRDGLAFVFDNERAVSCTEDLKDRETFLKELQP